MAPFTISPPNTPQNRFVTPWLNWDSKSLVAYDMKRPEGYEEVLADARYLLNKIEKRNPNWYPRIRSRDVWESLFGVSAEHEHSYRCARIEGHVLDPEDMNRALVRKFFLWPRHENYITTNQGREVPYRIANNPRNLTATENPLLLGSYNTQKPRDAPLIPYSRVRVLARTGQVHFWLWPLLLGLLARDPPSNRSIRN